MQNRRLPSFCTNYINEQIDAILLDFTKAFDKVPHRRLLQKIEKCSVRGNILECITSFLQNRTQQVKLEGQHQLLRVFVLEFLKAQYVDLCCSSFTSTTFRPTSSQPQGCLQTIPLYTGRCKPRQTQTSSKATWMTSRNGRVRG